MVPTEMSTDGLSHPALIHVFFRAQESRTGSAPMRFAASRDRQRALRMMIAAWPDVVRQRDGLTRSALHDAAAADHADVVEILVRQHPEGVKCQDSKYHTPLFSVTMSRLSSGARATQLQVAAAAAMVHSMVRVCPSALLVRDGGGRCPLHVLDLSHTELVSLFAYSCPACVRLVDSYGDAPVHMAADKRLWDTLAVLLEACPEATELQDQWGRTPMHLIAPHCHLPTLQRMLAAAPNCPMVPDEGGMTPLHAIAGGYRDDVDAVSAMVAVCPGAAQVRNRYGDTPLMVAATNRHTGSMRAMLQACPEAGSVKDNWGRTPAEVAARTMTQ